MLNYWTLGLAASTLIVSVSSHAQPNRCKIDATLDGCGIAFTDIGTIPALSDMNCTDPVSVTYTIANEGDSDTPISISLTDNDDLGDSTAVVIDDSTTCPNPGTLDSTDSCNIVLDFQPCIAGDLNWSLTVTPVSTQRPLVLPLTATVAHDPAIAYIVNYGSGSADGSGTISICEVNEITGALDACTNPPVVTYGVTLGGPASIVLTTDRTFAYITNFGNYDGTTVTICPVNSDYTLGSEDNPCYSTTGPDSDSNPTFNQPNGIALSADNTTLYVGNGGNGGGSTGDSIVACPILEDGSLDACVVTAAGAEPNGVYYQVTADDQPLVYAIDYYTSGTSGTGIVNLMDATDPVNLVPYSTPTDDAGGTLNGPIAIAFNPTGSIAYLVNLGDNPGTITYCPVNSDGTFNDDTCANTVIDDLLEYPAGLWVTASKIYISNNAGNITFCEISSVDGSLSDCENLTDPTFNSPNDVFISNFP